MNARNAVRALSANNDGTELRACRTCNEVYSEVAYAYDGSLEGLLSAIFAAYARREHPADVAPEHLLQPRLGQRVARIETDFSAAARVKRGLTAACGYRAFDAVRKASLSSDAHAGTAAYRFVRYAMDEQKRRDCPRCRKRATCAAANVSANKHTHSGKRASMARMSERSAEGSASVIGRHTGALAHTVEQRASAPKRAVEQSAGESVRVIEHRADAPQHASATCPKLRGRALSDLTHPAVAPLFAITRAIDNECEHMRQFIRFEHLQDASTSVFYARCNPRDAVVPLIMPHFVERFNVQPFIIYDENHHLAGVYDTTTWYLVRTDGADLAVPPRAANEALIQNAWRRFYRTVSVDARYNPELRRHFMPKRFWKNLTEMQEDAPALARRE